MTSRNIIIFAAILLIGCNPVKKVLKDPEKVQAVVADWIINNPMPSDTVYKAGDTVTLVRDSVRVDTSIRYEYREDTLIEIRERVITKIVEKVKTVTDTVTITDRRIEQMLRDKIKAQDKIITDQKAKIKTLNNERWLWRALFLGLILAAIIIIWKR